MILQTRCRQSVLVYRFQQCEQVCYMSQAWARMVLTGYPLTSAASAASLAQIDNMNRQDPERFSVCCFSMAEDVSRDAIFHVLDSPDLSLDCVGSVKQLLDARPAGGPGTGAVWSVCSVQLERETDSDCKRRHHDCNRCCRNWWYKRDIRL